MPYLIVVLVVLALGVGSSVWSYTKGRGDGWAVRDGECKVQLAGIESERAEQARQAFAWKERSRRLADELAEQAAQAEAKLNDYRKRMANEIDRLASNNRRSLDAALVRVLNQRAEIREYVDGRPVAAAAGTAAPDAGTRADSAGSSGGTSERALAHWIVAAKASYETCRTRLHALQDWVATVTEKGS